MSQDLKIFMSSAGEDPGVIGQLKAKLLEVLAGAGQVFLDRELEASRAGDMRAMIRDAIRDCNVLVVHWTERTASSERVLYELGMADALDKRIMFLADPSAPRIPAELRDHRVVPFSAVSRTTGFRGAPGTDSEDSFGRRAFDFDW